MQDVLDCFESRTQTLKLSKADVHGALIDKLASPGINLSPAPVMNADGTVCHPGIDNHNHTMGTTLEEKCYGHNDLEYMPRG